MRRSELADLTAFVAVADNLSFRVAAARLGVPASECVAAMSVITHRPSGRKLSFGAVAAEAAKMPPPDEVALKDPREWKLAGKPRRRLDVPAKVTGQPIYAIDVRLPGMLYAAVAHCPVFGGVPKAANESAIAIISPWRSCTPGIAVTQF